MAELNFNALIPEGPRGFYQGFEQGQDQRIARETNQFKFDELKRDRDEAMQLQTKLKSMGQDPDLNKYMDTLIATGKPEYVQMAIEGKQKLKDLEAYAKLGAGGATSPAMPTAAPAPSAMRMPQAVAPTNALGSGMFGMEAPAPTNALAAQAAPMAAPPAPAPVNALAPQAQQAQARITQLLDFARTNPRMAKQAMEEARLLQDQLELFSRNKPALPAKVQEYEYAKQNGYKGSFADFTTLHAPRTTVNVPVNVSTEKKYGEQFASKMADTDIAKMTTAERAPELAANADRVLDILKQGNVFTGSAADIKLNIARALNVVGASNDDKIANTEGLISGLAKNTLGAVKSSGLGTGQGFTDKDLQFLQDAEGGRITLNAQTLQRLAGLSRKAAESSAAAWNSRVKQMPKSAIEGTGLPTEPIQVPKRTEAPPAMYAVNPKTGERIQSTDGGNTWKPVGAK